MIRKMHESDRNAVIEILNSTDMFTAAELALATEQIDICLTNSIQSDYFIVVLESEDFQVIGFLSFGPAPITEDAYNLYWIAVHSRFQGRGHGRELLLWLEKSLQAVSARIILIETSSLPKYKPTRRFYCSMGFEEISCIPDFYKPGDDRITYVKQLIKKKIKKNISIVEIFKAEL